MNEFDHNNSESLINFEPHSLIRDVLRNLWTIILAALIGIMSVYIWNHSVYTPMYTSTATLLVNLKNSASYAYTNLSASSEMAEIFTEVFVQPTMKNHAADYLGEESFVGEISTSVLTNTNIFTLSVTSGSPETSYRELCAILEIYPEISEAVFSDSVIEVMRSPNLPAAPSNAVSERYGKLAACGCAMIVLAIIVILSLKRDTVKDEKGFREMIDSKLFGVVAHERPHKSLHEMLSRKKTSLLISDAYATFRFTENYHKIATKFEYLRRNENAKVFLVTSIAENEGKSTAAANIALALAGRGNRVALLDMDFKKPAIHRIFDLYDASDVDLADLLSGRVNADEFKMIRWKNTNLELALNMKSHINYSDWIYSERVMEIIDGMRYRYDCIIIDTPPISAEADVSGLFRLADRTVMIVRTDCVYAADINDEIITIEESGCAFEGCILNDVHREISLAGQLGLDETAYCGKRGYYGYYSKYHDYSNSDLQ